MPDIRVQDEQGTVHVFPDGSTPDMIAKVMNVKVAGAAPPVTDTIGAEPQPTTFAGKAEKLFHDFSDDIRHGTGRTMVGRGLQKLGIQPTDNGQGAGAGDFMASPLLGPARALEGSAQIGTSGKNWQGVKNVVGGTLEAAQIPGSFVAPEAGPIAEAVSGKVGAATKPTAKMAERVLGTLGKTADMEGFTLAGKTVPEAFSSLTDQFIGRAKSAYQAIDKAVNGELQPVLDKITDLKKAIKIQKNLDPDKAVQLSEQLDEMLLRRGEVLDAAKQNGMANAEDILQKADKDYSRGKALEAMTKKAKGASGAAREGGKTNPSKFATLVDNVSNQEKLTRALGPDALSELQSHARNALSVKKAHKIAVGVAGTGAGGAALYGIKEIGGSQPHH